MVEVPSARELKALDKGATYAVAVERLQISLGGHFFFTPRREKAPSGNPDGCAGQGVVNDGSSSFTILRLRGLGINRIGIDTRIKFIELFYRSRI